MTKKKTIIIIAIAFLILIIASILIIILVKNNKEETLENKINIEELENNFSSIFTNTIHPENDENKSIVYAKYNIVTEESGKYKINTNIPLLGVDTEESKRINDSIFEVFVKKIMEVMENTDSYTVYNVDYVSYVNGNIISIAIKSTIKEGANPQRLMMRTYNYDIEEDKILTLQDIISTKGLKEENVQENILAKIEEKISQNSVIQNTGYNVYQRNINNSIYKVANTAEFFLGDENVLYIVYPYGNTNYTSEMDLVICE